MKITGNFHIIKNQKYCNMGCTQSYTDDIEPKSQQIPYKNNIRPPLSLPSRRASFEKGPIAMYLGEFNDYFESTVYQHSQSENYDTNPYAFIRELNTQLYRDAIDRSLYELDGLVVV